MTQVFKKNATIANGATTSDAIELGNHTLVGIEMPATFTGTALSFQAAYELNGTYKNVYKDGADVSKTVAASKHVVLLPSEFAGVKCLKVVSNSSEGGARTVGLIMRGIE